MTTIHVTLAITLAAMGLLFLVFALLFFCRKEKACMLIAGFNSMTERQQAQYDRAAIARDYGRLFAWWSVGAFSFAGLTLLFGWLPYIAAFALWIVSLIPHMHLWAENAFAKYKMDK